MNFKGFVNWGSLALLAILITSCDGMCIRGNRDVIEEYRSADEYSGIVSEGSWDVIYYQDSISYVVVEAESNLMPYISTSVRGDELVIRTRDKRCINNRKPVIIHAYGPNINRVLLEGSGSIDAEMLSGERARIRISGSGDIYANVFADELEADISGSGEMFLNGEVIESELEISGSGDINAYDLLQETCFATISGSGDMYVHVTGFLDVKITGSGDLFYRGEPEVHTSILGSGSVNHTW